MARSFTIKEIATALKRKLGASAKKYSLDETYVDNIIGVKSGGRRESPFDSRHEAAIIEKILDDAGMPAQIVTASRGGFWVYVPKITPY